MYFFFKKKGNSKCYIEDRVNVLNDLHGIKESTPSEFEYGISGQLN
jgi:hypothetical protein